VTFNGGPGCTSPNHVTPERVIRIAWQSIPLWRIRIYNLEATVFGSRRSRKSISNDEERQATCIRMWYCGSADRNPERFDAVFDAFLIEWNPQRSVLLCGVRPEMLAILRKTGWRKAGDPFSRKRRRAFPARSSGSPRLRTAGSGHLRHLRDTRKPRRTAVLYDLTGGREFVGTHS